MLARTGSAEKPLRKRRFTSNVVAPLTFAADVICLAIAVPAAISLHQLLIGGFLELRAHLGPLLIAVVGFVLIRLSRDAYGGPTGVREADHAVVADFLIAIMLSVAAIWRRSASACSSFSAR